MIYIYIQNCFKLKLFVTYINNYHFCVAIFNFWNLHLAKISHEDISIQNRNFFFHSSIKYLSKANINYLINFFKDIARIQKRNFFLVRLFPNIYRIFTDLATVRKKRTQKIATTHYTPPSVIIRYIRDLDAKLHANKCATNKKKIKKKSRKESKISELF